MAKSEKPTRSKVPTRPDSVRKGSGFRKNQPSAKPRAANQHASTEVQRGKMTEKRWQDYLANVANGMPHRDAAHAVKLTMQTVDAYLISNIAAAGQLHDAKVLWNRRDWPLEKIEDVLLQISLGKTIKQAFDECGIERSRVASLYRIFLTDKSIRKWYDDARALWAEAMADEAMEISDATHNDRNEDGKIDHEVINRDRLRVDTRKFLMGKFAVRRFGDTKHHVHEGDINVNHAAVLSGGRKRIEQLHARRSGKTIEGEATPVEQEG